MKDLLLEIKELINKGLSYRTIGKMLGVHHSTISYRMRTSGVKIRDSSKFVKEGTKTNCEKCGREYIKDRKKGHKGTICNSCSARKDEENNKNIIIQIAGDQCCKCNYNKCKQAIDYHHVDYKNKKITIANSISYSSVKKIIEEIYKCIPFCSNCHREYHAGLFSYKDLNYNILKEYQKQLILSCDETLANMPNRLLGAELPNK